MRDPCFNRSLSRMLPPAPTPSSSPPSAATPAAARPPPSSFFSPPPSSATSPRRTRGAGFEAASARPVDARRRAVAAAVAAAVARAVDARRAARPPPPSPEPTTSPRSVRSGDGSAAIGAERAAARPLLHGHAALRKGDLVVGRSSPSFAASARAFCRRDFVIEVAVGCA